MGKDATNKLASRVKAEYTSQGGGKSTTDTKGGGNLGSSTEFVQQPFKDFESDLTESRVNSAVLSLLKGLVSNNPQNIDIGKHFDQFVQDRQKVFEKYNDKPIDFKQNLYPGSTEISKHVESNWNRGAKIDSGVGIGLAEKYRSDIGDEYYKFSEFNKGQHKIESSIVGDTFNAVKDAINNNPNGPAAKVYYRLKNIHDKIVGKNGSFTFEGEKAYSGEKGDQFAPNTSDLQEYLEAAAEAGKLIKVSKRQNINAGQVSGGTPSGPPIPQGTSGVKH
jgi:hypothetical protein